MFNTLSFEYFNRSEKFINDMEFYYALMYLGSVFEQNVIGFHHITHEQMMLNN